MKSSISGLLEVQSVSQLGWLAVALVAVTGVLHIYAGIVEGRLPVGLAGVGFLAAIGLYLVDYRRPLLYLVGIVYTAIQIPFWYVVKGGEFTTVGYLDKAVQVVLIVVLAYLYWQTRTAATDSPTASHAG